MSKQEMQEMADAVANEVMNDRAAFDSCVLGVDPVKDDGGEVIGLEILRTFGGPTVWVDTYEGLVYAHEQGAQATAEVSEAACARLNAYYGLDLIC